MELDKRINVLKCKLDSYFILGSDIFHRTIYLDKL